MPRKKKDVPVPRNRPYGERARNEQAVGMIDQGQTPPGGSPPESMPGAPGGHTDPMAVAQQTSLRAGLLGGPSRSPNIPVTDGLPVGPGRGPQALTPQRTGPTELELQMYAKYLPALEVMASRQDSTPGTRSLARRLRSMIPPGYMDRLIAQSRPEPE